MMLKLNCRRVLLMAFMSNVICISTAKAQQKANLAPEASAAEIEGSFRDIPVLEEAYFDIEPKERKDGIPVGKLGIDGGDKAAILQLAQAIAASNDTIFDSFLIAHKGKLILNHTTDVAALIWRIRKLRQRKLIQAWPSVERSN